MRTLGEARRMALAAQGFDRPRPASGATIRDVRRVIHQLGLLQIDYVNVLGPAQYQVLFSRLGFYDRALLDELVYRRREFTEQWAHEASIVPMAAWPLLAYRREDHRARPWGFEADEEYSRWAIEQIRERGPLHAAALPAPEGAVRSLEHAWSKSVQRAVLEVHFGRGVLAVARRLPNFARELDLAERIVPAEHLQRTLDRGEQQRALLLLAARSHGIGTAADLADYYRMPIGTARARLAELVEAGALETVSVEGWNEPALAIPGTRVPREIRAAALLSPFDPVVWFRPRARRLFGFDYRVEIFFPEAKRKWGYYVLPFLLGEKLTARVDLKADRAGGRLLVLSAHAEEHVVLDEVASALAAELRELARWYDLASVKVSGRAAFELLLARAVKRLS